MDLERRLISRALYDTDIDLALNAGVTGEMFYYPDNRAVFVFMERCRREYGRSPTPRMAKEVFPHYRFIDDVEEPLGWLVAELLKEERLVILSEAGPLISEALDAKDADRAQQLMSEAAQRAALASPNATKDVNVGDVVKHYIQMFRDRATGSGLLGLPTGFPTIDDATLGFQPGQFVTIAGLAGAGKSTLLMKMAQHIQRQGHVPHFVSFEMSEEEQMGRYVAMGVGLNYRRLVSGRLKDDEWVRADRFGEEVAEHSVFALCTDIARTSTVPGLERRLEEMRPSVALIDGVYMMRDPETKKSGADWQAMTNITRGLKQMAQRLEIPVVVSTQALPSKTTKGRNSTRRQLDMYSPGYSSSFAQDSDVALGLERDDRRPAERLLRITKSRHSANRAVWIEWNWKSGRFGEEREKEEYDEDDEEDDEDD